MVPAHAPERAPSSGERLAARTLELIDIPSESRDEARLAAHVRGLLPDARDLGDTCVLAGPEGARVLLGGHLDTVPAQGNRPGRRDAERVLGLGASDMKGALAVMIELDPRRRCRSARCSSAARSCRSTESALTPLLARHPLSPELVVMMEPTDNAIHAGCLGNVNATWTFRGRAGHSARPWFADNAITRAAAGVDRARRRTSPSRTTSTGSSSSRSRRSRRSRAGSPAT